MERLGETYEFGTQLLRLLELAGWTVSRFTAIGGAVAVVATKQGLEVKALGDTLAEAAYPVFEEATRLQGLRPAEPLQLELV